MRILIVEDNFDTRLIMKRFVDEYGEVIIAVDGKEAIYAVEHAFERDEPYDLILMDIMMPGLDGFEALEKIRIFEDSSVRAQKAVIIMTTAIASEEDVKKAFAKGCDGYLKKPFNRAQLRAELEKHGLPLPEAD